MTPHSRCLVFVLTLTLSLTATLRAQTSASSATSDETVKLSEFTVKTDADHSYIASESVTGTRVATPIKDLTFNVSVVTSEFLNDFGYFEIDNLGYTSSLDGFDNGGGNLNMRGFAATSFLRNGYLRLGLIDRVNMDRIEIIRGPSATIYGYTTPAGMINIITKQPKTTPQQYLSVAVGSYGTDREEMTVTGPVGFVSNTYYTLSAALSERTYNNLFNTSRTKTVSLGVIHKFSDSSNVLVEFESL